MKKIILVLWALILGAGYCHAESLTLLNDTAQVMPLQHHQLAVFEDPEDAVRIDDILSSRHLRFSDVRDDTINLGHTASSIWARFSVRDTQNVDTTQSWLLEIGYPLLQRVDIFLVSENRVVAQYQIGYARKMDTRELNHRFFVQPLQLEPNKDYQVYVNVMRKNGSVQLPLKLYQPAAFLKSELKANYIFGLFFGILVAMMVYNLYLYFAVSDRTYLYYIFYIASVSMAFMTTTGYGYLLLWDQYPGINEYALQIPSSLAAICGLLFARKFIKIKRYNKRLDQLALAMAGMGIALALTRLFTHFFLSEAITLYIAVISIVMPAIAYWCWRQGSRPAAFFLLGWILLLIGSVLYTFSLLAILPINAITANAVCVGAAMETLLLSLGLADRINSERKARYQALQAQHGAMVRLQETENRLVHRALHNGVTGLPNRTLLRSLLDDAIQARKYERLSLVLVNLNNFHEFNKTLGHSIGDAILQQIAKRINDICSKVDGIVKLESDISGDHYLAAIEGVTFAYVVANIDAENVLKQAAAQLHTIEHPLEFQGLTLDIDATLSLAHYPDHGDNSEHLIRNANIALEAAAGSNEKIAEYAKGIDPYNERRISLLGELRHAIENDALQLHFQPQINLSTNAVAGAEVLIRWIHPEYGFISPAEFIPLAERTGVIRALTYWVCRQAFCFKTDLEKLGYDFGLSIHISARNLQDPDFKRRICELAAELKTPLDKIVLELTETAVMTDPDEAMRMMAELNSAGIRLSIDDFGTGYSSLSYLKRLPVDELKIDRSFVMELTGNRDDQLLVRTTLNMGHNFSMAVVAEGVEDEQTLNLLREMGCDLAQGYHIARPMAGKDFTVWLANYQQSLAALTKPQYGHAK